MRICSARALDEQLNRTIPLGFIVNRCIGGRHVEWSNRIQPFAPRSERLPASGNDVQSRAIPQYLFCKRSGGTDNVLARIQHKQLMSVRQHLRHVRQRTAATGKIKSDGGSHRGREEAWIGERRELSEPDSIVEVRQQLARCRQCQPRLTDAAGAG
jgi:hypothetical protein